MHSHDSASRQFRLGWWFLQPHLATPGSRGSVWMVAGLGWCPHDGFARTLGQAQLACPLTQPRGLGDPQDAGLRTGWLPAPRAQLRSRPGQAQCPSHWDLTSQAVKDKSIFEEGCHPAPLLEDPGRQGGAIRRKRREYPGSSAPLQCHSPQPWSQRDLGRGDGPAALGCGGTFWSHPAVLARRAHGLGDRGAGEVCLGREAADKRRDGSRGSPPAAVLCRWPVPMRSHLCRLFPLSLEVAWAWGQWETPQSVKPSESRSGCLGQAGPQAWGGEKGPPTSCVCPLQPQTRKGKQAARPKSKIRCGCSPVPVTLAGAIGPEPGGRWPVPQCAHALSPRARGRRPAA